MAPHENLFGKLPTDVTTYLFVNHIDFFSILNFACVCREFYKIFMHNYAYFRKKFLRKNEKICNTGSCCKYPNGYILHVKLNDYIYGHHYNIHLRDNLITAAIKFDWVHYYFNTLGSDYISLRFWSTPNVCKNLTNHCEIKLYLKQPNGTFICSRVQCESSYVDEAPINEKIYNIEFFSVECSNLARYLLSQRGLDITQRAKESAQRIIIIPEVGYSQNIFFDVNGHKIQPPRSFKTSNLTLDIYLIIIIANYCGRDPYNIYRLLSELLSKYNFEFIYNNIDEFLYENFNDFIAQLNKFGPPNTILLKN